MPDYVVNRTVTSIIGIKADSVEDAEEKVLSGQGTLISRNSTIRSQERPAGPPQRAQLREV